MITLLYGTETLAVKVRQVRHLKIVVFEEFWELSHFFW